MSLDGSEFEGRVERLRTELRSRKLGALLIDDCEATAYDIVVSPLGCNDYSNGRSKTKRPEWKTPNSATSQGGLI